jgi:hypothetical protein
MLWQIGMIKANRWWSAVWRGNHRASMMVTSTIVHQHAGKGWNIFWNSILI